MKKKTKKNIKKACLLALFSIIMLNSLYTIQATDLGIKINDEFIYKMIYSSNMEDHDNKTNYNKIIIQEIKIDHQVVYDLYVSNSSDDWINTIEEDHDVDGKYYLNSSMIESNLYDLDIIKNTFFLELGLKIGEYASQISTWLNYTRPENIMVSSINDTNGICISLYDSNYESIIEYSYNAEGIINWMKFREFDNQTKEYEQYTYQLLIIEENSNKNFFDGIASEDNPSDEKFSEDNSSKENIFTIFGYINIIFLIPITICSIILKKYRQINRNNL